MKKVVSYIYVFGFLFALLLPLIIYPFVSGKLDHNNYENRELTSKEVVLASNWSNFFPNLQLYIDDNMPYKNECVAWNKQIDLNVFHDLYDESVFVGKENWLFYKKDGCIQDYRGGYVLNKEELEAYRIAAQALQDNLQNKGIKLFIMITPNKEEVMGDLYLPDKVTVKNEKSRTDQIVAYLKANTDIPVMYSKDIVCEYRDKGVQVWKKYDTHWNNLGAYVATQELLEQMGKDTISLESLTIEQSGQGSGDLANMIGMGSQFNDDWNYSITGYKEEIQTEMVENIPQSNLSYAKFESNIHTGDKILCIGDSFLGYMEPYIAVNFDSSIFVHRDNYGSFEYDLIDKEKPDVIVFQTAERFISYFDDAMNVFAQK